MAHSSTILSQVLRLVPRHEFERLASAHAGERGMHTASRWKQFVALAAGQLAGRHSLRDVVAMLGSQAARLYHLGGSALARSTLARVNAEQPCGLYEALFGVLVARCQGLAPGHRFRFRNRLFSFDASLIELSVSLFPWHYFAKGKAAVKLHVGLDHAGFLPVFATMTEPHASEAGVLAAQRLPKGSIVVYDKAVNRFALWRQLDDDGTFFVTRAKRDYCIEVVRSRSVAAGGAVLADETVHITGKAAARDRLPALRRVVYRDPETAKQYVFLTNNHRLAAATIAAIYKERWRIELFFKWMKQNLRIKTFIGESLNAVLTQIWVAICVYLLLAYLKFISRAEVPLSHILRLLQVNLFIRRDLVALIHPSAADPPPKCPQNQLAMAI